MWGWFVQKKKAFSVLKWARNLLNHIKIGRTFDYFLLNDVKVKFEHLVI